MGAVLRELVIDCNDPRRVADFWAQVLGWKVQEAKGSLWMSESGAPFPDFLLVFGQVPETKSGKNRLHIDVSPVGCDRDAEVARLEALGAQRVDIGQGDEPWIVLADPEGNEFCVLGRRADVR
jgi:predicted enzyme related to lactoylglutathione lyase